LGGGWGVVVVCSLGIVCSYDEDIECFGQVLAWLLATLASSP